MSEQDMVNRSHMCSTCASLNDIQKRDGFDIPSFTVSSSKLKDENATINSTTDNHEKLNIGIPIKPTSAYISITFWCILIAFGGFISGWDTGTIGGFLAHPDYLRRFGSRNKNGIYYFSNVRTGLVVSIFNLGCMIGCLTLSNIANKIGRKKALTVTAIIYIVGIVIQIASINKWYQYFIGRIIAGLGVGGMSIFSPMLLAEVSPKHMRGTLGSFFQLMCTLGILLGDCTNYGTKDYSNSVQWRVPLGLCFVWALFMAFAMLFVPESPRYLMAIDRVEEAKKSVAVSNRVTVDDPGVQNEVDIIAAGIAAERAIGTASWPEMFSPKGKVLQRLIMCCVINSLQQLSGINYFFYYGITLFKTVGLDDTYQTAIVFAVVGFFSTFPALYILDKFGRRTCLLWGAVFMVSFMVVFASVGVKRLYPNGKNGSSSKGAGDCMIIFSCFFIFSTGCTWAPIGWLVSAENFPLRVKAKGMALSAGSNWLWNFLVSFFTPFIADAIGFSYGYVFMGCMLFGCFFVFFFVPETKGLTLDEVNEMWLEGVAPWKSASWIPASKRETEDAPTTDLKDKIPLYKRLISFEKKASSFI